MTSASDHNLFDGGADFDCGKCRQKYIAHRPDYNLSGFYDQIWEYHRQYSDNWRYAHDVGTGPGNVAQVLKDHFNKVIASDSSQFHVDVARKCINSPDVTVIQSRAGELLDAADSQQRGKIDLITLTECIPLMNAEKALAVSEKLLGPGDTPFKTGTVAIWFYGKPIFVGDREERSQQIYDEIIAKAFARIYPLKGTPMQSTFSTMACWLDNVKFPTETWSHVERIKWNHERPLSFLNEGNFDFNVDYASCVSHREQITEHTDRGFWAKQDCGIKWVKGFIEAQFPWIDKDFSQLEPMFEELEQAMGGKGSKTKIAWPVALLLATKT